MSVVTDFTVDAESFALSHTLSAEPDMVVEAERLASHSTEWVFPFHWISGGDFTAFDEAIADDPTVSDATIIEKADDSVLYQIEWSDAFTQLIIDIIDQHANILHAEARDEQWRLKLRFAKEHQVSSFQEYFAEAGREFTVNKIYHPTSSRQREYGLTAEQHDTLVTAFDKGYFTVPRDISMEELADALGISSNAVSQRLRRATANLIKHTLTIGTDENTDKNER